MSGRKGFDEDVAGKSKGGEPRIGWPAWVRSVVTVALLLHFVALVAAALGSTQPASLLEQAVARRFIPYYDIIDQGYAYHFYAPEPPNTPVIVATLHYSGDRPDEIVRLPDRKARPRLRYQRQLALATWLYVDYQDALMSGGNGSKSRVAQSYARHLCRTRPGCTSVTLHSKMHRIPDLREVADRLEGRYGEKVDIDSDEYYDVPEWIGDYTCDAL